MKRLILFIVAPLLFSSCVAALIGGGAYKSAKTKEQRQQFTSEFQKTNMEREVRGLAPLDWCSEAYKFDEGYANNDKQCAKRINAYKKGDTNALNMGPTSPAASPATTSGQSTDDETKNTSKKKRWR